MQPVLAGPRERSLGRCQGFHDDAALLAGRLHSHGVCGFEAGLCSAGSLCTLLPGVSSSCS
jgi:hypothetical protein